MKYLIKLMMLTGIFFASSALATESNIAVLDIQKIMTDSAAAKSIQEQISKKRDSYQKEVNAKEEALKKEHQDLSAKKDKPLAQDDPKMKEFNEKVNKTRKYVQDSYATLENASATAISELQKQVTEILEKMADEKKFTVVIPAQQLVYAKKDLDITEEVLKKLDSKVKTINVKFEAPKEDDNGAKKATKK